MSTVAETTFDLSQTPLRELNQHLHDLAGTHGAHIRVTNTSGAHAVACGIDAELEVDIDGHVGYYCAGMNKLATVRVHGNAGSGLAENMMSGRVEVDGSASQYCGATAHGGLIVVRGDTSLRCGISLKGGEIVVRGSVGGTRRVRETNVGSSDASYANSAINVAFRLMLSKLILSYVSRLVCHV